MDIEAVKGLFFGVGFSCLLLAYLAWLDTKLMSSDQELHERLTISLWYKCFCLAVNFALIGGSAAVALASFDGSGIHPLIAAAFGASAMVIAVHFTYLTFIQVTEVKGPEIRTHSPFGEKQIDISKLEGCEIERGLNTFVLRDRTGQIRFSLYINSRRALIEHIIQYAPKDTTSSLSHLLEKY